MTFEPLLPEGTSVQVIAPDMPLRPLDYKAPEGGVRPGAFVEVPLGPRRVKGVVWGPGAGDFPLEKLKAISNVLDAPPLPRDLRDFLERAAGYTLTPLPLMVRLATRVPGLGDPPQMRRLLRATGHRPEKLTEARARVLDALEEFGGAALPLADLTRAAGVGSSVVKGLISMGAIREEEVAKDAPYPRLDPARPGRPLSEDQAAAAESLRQGLRSGSYGTTMLKGVTGSGKTEVYLEAVAECLAIGKQALVLLPEIALTADFMARVEARFGARPGEWHSGMTTTERRRLWKMCAEGGVGMVAGARSALFLPFQDLGLIVVDEEHDTSYKQEDGVYYSARDMAVLRASMGGARVVLASATPSLETWVNAHEGRYGRIDLLSRFGTAELPEMRAVDLRKSGLPSGKWIAPEVADAIQGRLQAGEQSLLFMNRRGYAPVTICRACGNQIACNHCDARMVEHRYLGKLVCHQCGDSRPVPPECPSCHVEGKLVAIGPGVERMAEEAQALFPEAKVKILSSDLYTSSRALKADIEAIAGGEGDIIVGTQIVAKGHNFPLLTLVGVVDADLGLQGSDLRAAERTFQLMRQVAGRAGRTGRRGLALLQTHQPEHPVIRAILSGDEEGFWRTEAEARKLHAMPPYGRLAGIIITANDPKVAFDIGNHLARSARPLQAIGAEVWGPAPAPIARIEGRHRVRLLIKASRRAPLQAALTDWLKGLKLPANARVAVDIDPQSFL
ncbi:primosomal protein N' [Falsigemmobacter intermedius]|uniref:primosomal protein N' n=1 Tax=Falsigemmobacter intermedius TaxID=1553448 RepID=UPI003F0FC83E